MRRLTNIAREDSLASWFGTTQTLLVALTAWVVLWLVAAAGAPRWRRAGWLMAAAMFTLHGGRRRRAPPRAVWDTLGGREDSGPSVLNLFPSYAWQILFVPLFGLFGLLLLVFVWYELRDRTGLLGGGGDRLSRPRLAWISSKG